MAVLRMRNEKYAIWPIFMAESPKFLHLMGNRRRRTRWWHQILTESRNKTVLRIRNEKYAIWLLVMAESPKLLHSSAMDLWTRLWGRYRVPQNVFLVINTLTLTLIIAPRTVIAICLLFYLRPTYFTYRTKPKNMVVLNAGCTKSRQCIYWLDTNGELKHQTTWLQL